MNFVWYNIDTGFVSHRRETKTVRGYIVEEGEQQNNRREPIATLSSSSQGGAWEVHLPPVYIDMVRFWCPPRSLIYRQERRGARWLYVLYSLAVLQQQQQHQSSAVGVHQHGKELDMGGATIISVSNVAIISSPIDLIQVGIFSYVSIK